MRFLALFVLIALSHASAAQGVAVNLSGAAPDSSAILDVSSNSQGFLPPRMNTAQRDAIVAPALGLIIFNISTNCIQWWNGLSWHDGCGNNSPAYSAGTVHCNGTPTSVIDVTNPVTGKIWMDRNLGAAQVAISSADALAFGDLYQWGRRADGHQCRNSVTTGTLSTTDQPAHGDFIITSAFQIDWRNPQNSNLWQGINGINNPCPAGYRLPTDAELNSERISWSNSNAAGAFASPLKLTVAGYRNGSTGALLTVGVNGIYWSSTISGSDSRDLHIATSSSFMDADARALGASVRCIKN